MVNAPLNAVAVRVRICAGAKRRIRRVAVSACADIDRRCGDGRDLRNTRGQRRSSESSGFKRTGYHGSGIWSKAEGTQTIRRMDQGHYLRHDRPRWLGSRRNGWAAAARNSKNCSNQDFTLVISGSSQAFRAVCTVVDGRGKKRRISIKGQGPRSYGLDGEATNCRVDRVDQHAGPLTVELYARISSLPLGTNSTSDAFGCVRVRSDGPWGKAYGRRCSRVNQVRER